ncbi:microtubule organization protein AKNA isoform 2-T3 [Discoglossus pictus]
MDAYTRPGQREDSQDEEENFTQYMDENGIIGIEDDQGLLGLDEQGILGSEEQGMWELEEQRILDLDEPGIMRLDEPQILQLDNKDFYPASPSDEDPSGMQSLDDQFILSEMEQERSPELLDMESLRSSEVIDAQQDTDDGLSSEEHPDVSLSLPRHLDWHPPSRDQQLDMTEDEQDRGSSVESWQDEQEESWSQGLSGAPYDERLSPTGFEDFGQTSQAEEQWRNPPIPALEENYPQSPIPQEHEPSKLSLSPSPQPSSWAPRLLNHLGGSKISPRIEDETLPESSNTDSGDGRAVTPPGIPRRLSITKARPQRTLPIQPSPTPLRRRRTEISNMKATKSSIIPNYGRGQLNYPLPDFSKVGPKVRFPRDDQVYQPPQPRRPDPSTQGVLVKFKSPADIVREVLLNSTEKPTEEASVTTVPQEFQTPQHATELVHQLQKDYHKLLTKYAEAENTIDRLRLGAKVSLYSDPPKPSQGTHMGLISQGSKPVEFTIPQTQVATISSVIETPGVSEMRPEPNAPFNSNVPPPDDTPPVISSQHPLDDVQATLTTHIGALSREVDLLEDLLQGGKLTPEQQQQAVWELRGSLEALERRYLRARDGNHLGGLHTGGRHQPEELDPKRVLEGAIFQLGVRLDEIQDRLDGSAVQPELSSQSLHMTDTVSIPPVPSSKTPKPALLPSYPQSQLHTEIPDQARADVGSVPSEVAVSQEDLPQPLLHKQLRVEKEYDELLSTYHNFKTLPDALGLEQAEWAKNYPQLSSSQEQVQDTRFQDHSHDSKPQKLPQATNPPDHPQTVRFQEHLQIFSPKEYSPAKKSQEYTQANRSEDHPQAYGSQNSLQASNLQEYSWTNGTQDHLQDDELHSDQKTTRPQDQLSTSRHSKGRSPSQASSTPHLEQHRSSNEWMREQPSLEDGRYSRRNSMSKSSAALTPRASLSAPPLHQMREHSPRSSVAELFLDGVRAQSPHSQRSSISSRSVSSSAQRQLAKKKRNSVQDGVASPETDSGFLGSESSRLSLLQKQRPHQNRELPKASPNRRKNGLLSIEQDQTPRTRKASWARRKEGGDWTSTSRARSPSPGPNSLTESESREQSPAGVSDFENEGYSDVVTSGASLLLSPIGESPHHNGDLLETRTARDQAIYDLQKEVTHLRQRLEKCLTSSPAQERPDETPPQATARDQQERVYRFASTRRSLLSDSEAAPQDPRTESPRGSGSEPRPNKGNRDLRGAYTGTTYLAPDTTPPSVPCTRCQESRSPVPGGGTSGEETRSSPVQPHCALCHCNCDSAERSGVSDCHICRRGARSRRVSRRGRWFLSETSPMNVAYMQPPLISYSQPGIYAPAPPSVYLPMGYSVASPRPSRTVTLSQEPSNQEDLSWPLNRALEAAKELKITSRKMCRSLTSDIGTMRSLRGSCLF